MVRANPNCKSSKIYPNPLTPKSEEYQLRERVRRIYKVITHKINELTFKQILSTNSLKKCMESSLENFYTDIRAWGLTGLSNTDVP